MHASLTRHTVQVAVLAGNITFFHIISTLKESVYYQIVLVTVCVDCLGLVW